MSVNYLETGSTDPYFNLAFEEYILENKLCGDWLILWQNHNTVVVGLNQNTAEEIDADFVAAHGIHVVRRRTGGGAVYHDLGNLNYSFITDLDDSASFSVSRFNAPICRALAKMGVPAETTGRNDVTVGDKKISGVAQRIYKNRILHHGTLLFDSDYQMLSGALHADAAKFSSKSTKSVRSRVSNIRPLLPVDMSLSLFQQRLLEELGADGLCRTALSKSELEVVQRVADSRYRSWDWNYGRSPKYDYVNRARFTGGSVEARLRIKDGIILEASFPGDYMAREENTPVCRALEGLPYRWEDVRKALSALELSPYFGSLTCDELLDVIFGSHFSE